MSKILFVLILAVCSFSFAKGTTASRQPANAVDPLAPLPEAAVDPLAPLPQKACAEAFSHADSGSVSDAMEAAEVCNEEVNKECQKQAGSTGDARYVAAYCRAKAAHGAYKAVKGKR